MSGNVGRGHAVSVVIANKWRGLGLGFRCPPMCIEFDSYKGKELGLLPDGFLMWMTGNRQGNRRLIWMESNSAALVHEEDWDRTPERSGGGSSVEKCASDRVLKDLEPWRTVVPLSIRPGSTYSSLLRQCRTASDLSEGKCIHAYILENGCDCDTFLGNLLIQMYGKCGSLEDARAVFDKMHQQNLFSWSIMIGVYMQHRHSKEALQLYEPMQREDVVPDQVTLVSILSACAMEAALPTGLQIHSSIVSNGFESNVIVGTALVNMFSKCGNFIDARRVFNSMIERNVVSWNALIAAHVHHEQGMEAMQLFQEMQLQNCCPDKVTFITILSACASQKALSEGISIHAQIVDHAFELDVVVENALVHMYGKCGGLQDACWIFLKMRTRNVVSWNTIIGAFAQHGQASDALLQIRQMQLEGVIPDAVTFMSILSACSSLGSLSEGKQMHAQIVGLKLEQDELGNALVYMYGKSGSTDYAQSMFEILPVRDVISWNAMIGGHTQSGQAKEALQLFDQMLLEGVLPDNITFVTILSVCNSQEALMEGKLIHARITDTVFESDVTVGNALVNMYGKCCSLKDAWIVLRTMQQRNTVSWNAMVSAYAQNGQAIMALQVFQQMLLDGALPDKTTFSTVLDACAGHLALAECKRKHTFIIGSGFELDVVVGTALITAYGKCGNFKDSQKLFDKLPQRNIFCWNAMISAYAQNGQGKEALQLFQQFELEGVMPNKVTFVSILSACASQAAAAEGKLLHSSVVNSGWELDLIVGTALVNMYGKFGHLEDARRLFVRMDEQNVISWNAMIAAYSQHELSKEALQLFRQMQLEGISPDQSTFVSVLSACANETLLAEGKRRHACFACIGFESDAVGNVLVNMYGKCGSLEDAWKVFDNLPEWNLVSWNAMISSYAQNGQCKEAMQLFNQMQLSAAVPDVVTFSSVLSACSHAGLVDEGCFGFVSMSQEHGITPTMEHYSCMIDLLGRAGQLEESEEVINNIPFQPSATLWMTLLSASRTHFDVACGRRAAEQTFELYPQFTAPYVVLSNMFTSAGWWDDAGYLRDIMKGKIPETQPAGTFIGSYLVDYF